MAGAGLGPTGPQGEPRWRTEDPLERLERADRHNRRIALAIYGGAALAFALVYLAARIGS